ncbi:MAG: poly-beta,6-N-acetyl-D-glucosamine N-deacetylase [Clostridia bacterium]|nr:poly-beta,6-N-acetyl-D-glucosamine N-deacetylase [Clostridia bacterium]
MKISAKRNWVILVILLALTPLTLIIKLNNGVGRTDGYKKFLEGNEQDKSQPSYINNISINNISNDSNANTRLDKGVVVLMFHNVKPGTALSPEKFRETLHLLKINHYNPISLATFHSYLEGWGEVPPRAVLFTFDDGYQDNYQYAAPILREFQYPAVVFPVMKWFSPYPRRDVDKSGRPAYQPHLTIAELQDMVKNGWEVGGHSYDGHWLVPVDPEGKERIPFLKGRMWLAGRGRLESENEYEARVWSDIMLMKAQMLELGLPTTDFAFPYGAYNNKLLGMLKQAGFKYFYTTEAGINLPGQELIYRVAVKSDPQETLKAIEKRYLTQKLSALATVSVSR